MRSRGNTAVCCRHEVDRFARCAHSDLDFRAHGHPLQLAAEDVDEERVATVSAVVADLVPKQAARDADARAIYR